MKAKMSYGFVLTLFCMTGAIASSVGHNESIVVEQTSTWGTLKEIFPAATFADLNSSLTGLLQQADKVLHEKAPAGETRAQRDDRRNREKQQLTAIFATHSFADQPVEITFQVSDVMKSQPPKPSALGKDASDDDRAQYAAELAASQTFTYLVVGNAKSSSPPVLTQSQLLQIKKAEDADRAIQQQLAADPGARNAARNGSYQVGPDSNGPAMKQRMQKEAASLVPPHVFQFYGTDSAVLKWKKGETHRLSGYIQSFAAVERQVNDLDKLNYIYIRATIMVVSDRAEPSSATMPSRPNTGGPTTRISIQDVQNKSGSTTMPSAIVSVPHTYLSLTVVADDVCRSRANILSNKIAPNSTTSQENDFNGDRDARIAELVKGLIGRPVMADLPIGEVSRVQTSAANPYSFKVQEWTLAAMHNEFNLHFTVFSNDEHVLDWKKGQRYPCRAEINKIDWQDGINRQSETSETVGMTVWLDAVAGEDMAIERK